MKALIVGALSPKDKVLIGAFSRHAKVPLTDLMVNLKSWIMLLSVQNPGSSGGSTRHKISPITENSEPDSSSSHASQVEAATKSASLMFKMSEETSADVGNTDADNVTRGSY